MADAPVSSNHHKLLVVMGLMVSMTLVGVAAVLKGVHDLPGKVADGLNHAQHETEA